MKKMLVGVVGVLAISVLTGCGSAAPVETTEATEPSESPVEFALTKGEEIAACKTAIFDEFAMPGNERYLENSYDLDNPTETIDHGDSHEYQYMTPVQTEGTTATLVCEITAAGDTSVWND
ncbi:MAG: LptM family lipoprotein [Gulosibacter sp.]|uniref:LptM family lipoprotein n=1 Tax=Gulosibacter sp. TaxID=2817531 RepID=UPI003F8EB7D2